MKILVTFSFIIFSLSLIQAQLYLGTGITRSFSINFNGGDLNYSYINIDNLPVTDSWIKDRSYNFIAFYTGYTLKKATHFHDFRLTFTKKGAISLLDKQDFYLDPIILDLQAFDVIVSGPSKLIELGVYNSVIGLRYACGKRIKNWLTVSGYLQTDVSYKKRFTVNWYSDYNNKHSSYYSENTYALNSFRKDSPLFNKISNINLELGINAMIHFGKYFAINLEVGQSIIPSVHKGPHPEYSAYTYFEKNEYFTSMQVGILTYFSK